MTVESNGNGKHNSSAAYAVFVVGFLLCAIAALTAYITRAGIVDELQLLRANRDYEANVNALLSALVDSETAYRGYLVTRDEAFLAPHEGSRRAYSAAMTFLDTITRGGDGERTDTRAFMASVDATYAKLEAVIAEARNGAAAADSGEIAITLLALKQSLDGVRQSHAAILDRAQKELTSIRTSTQRSLTRLFTTVLLATAGVALIFLVLARDMTQLVKQAVRARTSARGEIEQIASALDVSRRRSEAFEARLRLTLVSARVKLFAINSSGEIVWASEAQIGLLGDRALPVRLTDLVVQPAPEAIAEHVSRAYLSGQTARFEIAVKSPDDGSRKWFLVTISGSDFYEEGALLGVAVDISDNKSREERNFWLTRELMHRTRNMLAIIQSLARHAAPDDPASKTFVPGFLARIYAISAVHDLLVASSYSRCGLRELVAATCGEDARRQDPRVAFAGVDIQLNPDATQTIGLALHELYASSRAHGALLSPQGAVAICSNIDGEGAAAFLRLDWKEVGQSVGAINADRLAAFIVKTNLPRMLNGKFTEHSESDGLYYTMTLPMDKVSVTEHASEPR